jgi:hypothetical protein
LIIQIPQFLRFWLAYTDFKVLPVVVKGQLILKSLLVSSILPKNELENNNCYPSLLGQKFFVRILEELKKPKSPFKIN